MKQAIEPMTATNLGTRKSGRKSGLTQLSMAAVRLRNPYVVMKNIETMRAMTFSSPIRMPASAMRNAGTSACRGSFSRPYPMPNQRGVMPSVAVAWRMRGALRMLPNADEIVAPQIPAMTMGGKMAMSRSTFGLPVNCALSTVNAKNVARPM